MRRTAAVILVFLAAFAPAVSPHAWPRVIVVSGGDEELKAEGYGRAAASKYELSVSASAKRLTDGDALLVKYKTNLPRMTVLYMSVRALDRVLVTRKQTVEAPEFAIRFGPFDNKKFSPGIYVVEVSCIPARQESDAVRKELGAMDDLVASAELRIGQPSEYETATGKRRAALTAELSELESLYGSLNAEYAAQQKEFDRKRWEDFSGPWKDSIKRIKDFDADYRAKMLVMDYAAQENVKMMMADTLDKLWARRAQDLYKANGLDLALPPSPDNRTAEALDKVMQELLSNSRSFILTFSTQKD